MSKFDDFVENVGVGTIIAGIVGVVVFLSPILMIGFGWVAGWIIKLIFGSYITDGLNLLLGTTRFEANHLPMICATLGVVGSFFKSTQNNNNKK